jgi:hypothetical protein
MKQKLLPFALATAMSTALGSAQAADWDITITNLTHGSSFTPLLVTAHPHDTHLFAAGAAASVELERLAECGELDPFLATADVGAADADTITNPASGLLMPGNSTTTSITTDETHLSILAMILPTNDGFVGLDSEHIPTAAGTYTYYLHAYDAGTEENDEVLRTSGSCDYTESGMIPNPEISTGVFLVENSGGTGVVDSSSDEGGVVHIHRGVLGDTNATGGVSDLDSTMHRWQNPVAKVVVTVN